MATKKAKKEKYGNVTAYLKAKSPKTRIVSSRSDFYEFNEPKLWVPTGLRPLDMAIGGRGIPSGRIILTSADASLGKTELGLQIGGEFQRYKIPGMIHFIETEGTVSPEWVERKLLLGDDHLVQPDIRDLENMFKYIEMTGLWHTKNEPHRPIFYYVDSLSMCPPGAVLEKQYHLAFKKKGGKAQIISERLERLEAKLRRTNCTLFFISQLRARISMDPFNPIIGDPQAVAGGAALGFYNSLHMRLRQVCGGERYNYEEAKKRDRVFEQEGSEVEIYTYKSKISVPFRKAFIPIYWRESAYHPAGFDPEEADLNWLVDRDLVSKYSGKDKAFVKTGNEIELPSGVHPFIGISGWKRLLAQEGIWDEVGQLMLDNIDTRCSKDEEMERVASVQLGKKVKKGRSAPKSREDDEEEEETSAELDQMDRDLENLDDDLDDFDEGEAEQLLTTAKKKGKKGKG